MLASSPRVMKLLRATFLKVKSRKVQNGEFVWLVAFGSRRAQFHKRQICAYNFLSCALTKVCHVIIDRKYNAKSEAGSSLAP